VVPRASRFAREEWYEMLKPRSVVPWSVLTALFALVIFIKVPLVAQEPVAAKKKFLDVERVYQIIAKKPVETGLVDVELRKLLIARRDAAVEVMKAWHRRYEDGREDPTIDRLGGAIGRVLDAQLELSGNPADHLQIHELRVEISTDLERREMEKVELGTGAPMDVAEARYKRLGCEIDLLRTKKILAKK
jgi:hypothetical protein